MADECSGEWDGECMYRYRSSSARTCCGTVARCSIQGLGDGWEIQVLAQAPDTTVPETAAPPFAVRGGEHGVARAEVSHADSCVVGWAELECGAPRHGFSLETRCGRDAWRLAREEMEEYAPRVGRSEIKCERGAW